MNGQYVGIDGCKGGWIAAILENGKLRLEKFSTVDKIVEKLPDADEYLIDMAIGLAERYEEKDWRPDHAARKELGKKGSSVFPVPCRQAVKIEGSPKNPEVVKMQRETNKKIMCVSLSAQTINIIPKIRELDDFLCRNAKYKNVFCESHPEMCFSRLNGEVILSKKSKSEGIKERCKLLENRLEQGALSDVREMAKKYHCKPDDILDAVCLAVTAGLKAEGECENIAAEEGPCVDSKGLRMQMVVPKKIQMVVKGM